uniref:Uncharacterized protein n=1 Tax=viral metagenome TaxID=1070528 RepID=A0A6C0I4K9_9ZZZZ
MFYMPLVYMSQFDLKDSKALNNNYKLVYNFLPNEVIKSDIVVKDSFLNVSFPNNNTTPNISTTMPTIPNTWQTTSLSIYNLIHDNIKSLTDQKGSGIVGELVIKLKPTTSSGTAYVCFLLKKSPDKNRPSNDVDNIMFLYNNATSVTGTITLNHTIVKQNACIYYKDVLSNHVFVFTTPILINAQSAAFIAEGIDSKDAPFSPKTPPNKAYSIITSITQLEEDQIYISCNPTGESDETLDTYNVPINSEYTDSKQQIDYMKMTVNFFIFALGLLFCYFFVPTIYKICIIDQIIRFHHAYAEGDAVPTLLVRLRTVDLYISFIVCVAVLTLAIVGFKESDYYLVTSGLFLAFFYGLSYVLVQHNKMSPDWRKPVKEYDDELIYDPKRNYVNFKDFATFAAQAAVFLLHQLPYIAAIVVFNILALIFYCLSEGANGDMWKSVFETNFKSYPIYVALIIILGIRVAIMVPKSGN